MTQPDPEFGAELDPAEVARLTGLAAEDLSSGRLVPILRDWRPVEFAISAVYPHRHLLSAKGRAFIDLLAARIGAFRQWMTPELGLGAEAGGSAS